MAKLGGAIYRRRMDTRIWRLSFIAFLAVSTALFLRTVQIVGIDFGPVWAAARAPAQAYDFNAVTLGQPWRLGVPPHWTQRPFVYPPTTLLLALPLGRLPFWPALVLWTAPAAALFLAWSRRAGAPWWLVLFTPVAVCLVAGQATLLAGALLLLGLAAGPNRWAGVAFGLAACIKPQLLLFLPVGLAAQGRWQAMMVTGATGLTLCAATVLAWGLTPWVEWLQALGRFGDLFRDPRVLPAVVTPAGFLIRHGIDGAWAWAFALVGAPLTWWTFRRGMGPAAELAALAGAALLVSPYALSYELALVCPLVATAFDRKTPWSVLLGFAFVIAYWSSGLAMLILGLAFLPLMRHPAGTAPRRGY